MGLCFEDQHEALPTLTLNCRPQGSLENAGRSARQKTPESRKRSVKSVALAVNHQVTTDMAYCPVGNTGAVPAGHCDE